MGPLVSLLQVSENITGTNVWLKLHLRRKYEFHTNFMCLANKTLKFYYFIFTFCVVSLVLLYDPSVNEAFPNNVLQMKIEFPLPIVYLSNKTTVCLLASVLGLYTF